MVLEETSRHTISLPKNSSPPVLVAEVLTLADRAAAEVSVSLESRSGWAWLVHGRRLIVWRFKSTSGSVNAIPARELTLPPSDVAHNARLINVIADKSVMAVSPEGTVRFWPNLAHETAFIELSVAELQGQECFSLTNIQPVGSVLATTTASVCLVFPTSSGSSMEGVDGFAGSNMSWVAYRMLKIPQGLLGGIGRRVSSLFWGSMSAEETKLVSVLGTTFKDDPEDKLVFVLTANALQKWLLIKDEFPDKMYYSCDIETLAKQAFAEKVWVSNYYYAFFTFIRIICIRDTPCP